MTKDSTQSDDRIIISDASDLAKRYGAFRLGDGVTTRREGRTLVFECPAFRDMLAALERLASGDWECQWHCEQAGDTCYCWQEVAKEAVAKVEGR